MRFTEKRKAERNPSKDTVIFYHADCTDGFTAAWVAFKKFGNKVFIDGAISGGASTSVAFTLPIGYRPPTYSQAFNAIGFTEKLAFITVQTNGQLAVIYEAGATSVYVTGYINLD
mgnify:CR=1 FL=1